MSNVYANTLQSQTIINKILLSIIYSLSSQSNWLMILILFSPKEQIQKTDVYPFRIPISTSTEIDEVTRHERVEEERRSRSGSQYSTVRYQVGRPTRFCLPTHDSTHDDFMTMTTTTSSHDFWWPCIGRKIAYPKDPASQTYYYYCHAKLSTGRTINTVTMRPYLKCSILATFESSSLLRARRRPPPSFFFRRHGSRAITKHELVHTQFLCETWLATTTGTQKKRQWDLSREGTRTEMKLKPLIMCSPKMIVEERNSGLYVFVRFPVSEQFLSRSNLDCYMLPSEGWKSDGKIIYKMLCARIWFTGCELLQC